MRAAARFAALNLVALALAAPGLVAPASASGKAAALPRARRQAAAPRRPTRLVLPYVALHVCPFECCVYRRWRANTRLRVYDRERATGGAAFHIAAGDSFEALTGDVYVLQAGLARVLTAHALTVGRARIQFSPGDSVPLLDYGGEGTFRAWLRGHETWLGEDDWVGDRDHPGPRGAPGWLRKERDPVTEWWVHIRTLDGREGWLRMDADQAVDNADACA